jgi:hypothetical protein
MNEGKRGSGGRIHGKRLHQQEVVQSLVIKYFMRIIGMHYQTKVKIYFETPKNEICPSGWRFFVYLRLK